jgi:hypothetical protein
MVISRTVLDQPDHRQRLIGRVLHQLQVGHALFDQPDRVVDFTLADALLRILTALPRQLLGLQFGQTLLARSGVQPQSVAFFTDDIVHAVELAHTLAHQHLLRPDVSQQLLDLRIGVAELLHQLALGCPQPINQATNQRDLGALREPVKLQAARDAHHFAQLLATGIQVTIAHLVEQLAGERCGARGRFATEHLQVARAQVIQLTADLGDARQVLVDQAKCLQRALVERGNGGVGLYQRAGALTVLDHRAISLKWVSGCGRFSAV